MQFSLLRMLVVLTFATVLFGAWIVGEQAESRRQNAAAAKMRKLGGEVYSRPKWLWTLMDSNSTGSVVGVALRYPGLTDDDLAILADCPDLIWLNVHRSDVSDKGLVHLTGLKKLQRLRLDESGVTDGGLASLAGLSELHTLNLSRTGITDAGLVQLARLPKLVTLDVQRTHVTETGVQRLLQALPNVQIAR